jgi:hypothetical protein
MPSTHQTLEKPLSRAVYGYKNALESPSLIPVLPAWYLSGCPFSSVTHGRPQQAADRKIGTGKRAVADAEKGKPSTGIAVYAAMLWALDLLDQVADVAAPEKDEEGQTLALSRERVRARPKTGLDNDF